MEMVSNSDFADILGKVVKAFNAGKLIDFEGIARVVYGNSPRNVFDKNKVIGDLKSSVKVLVEAHGVVFKQNIIDRAQVGFELKGNDVLEIYVEGMGNINHTFMEISVHRKEIKSSGRKFRIMKHPRLVGKPEVLIDIVF